MSISSCAWGLSFCLPNYFLFFQFFFADTTAYITSSETGTYHRRGVCGLDHWSVAEDVCLLNSSVSKSLVVSEWRWGQLAIARSDPIRC